MSKFLVERYLPGLTSDLLAAAAGRAKETTFQLRQKGTPVEYLRSTFVPGEDKCYCLFEGPSAEVVRSANEQAAIPFERIVEVQDIRAEDLG